MTTRDDPSPDQKKTEKTKASVLEAMGTLMGNDTARRDGARRKQAPAEPADEEDEG